MSRLSSSRNRPLSAMGRAVVTMESTVQVHPSTRSSLIRDKNGIDSSDFVKRTVERYRKAVEDIEAKRVSTSGAVKTVPRLFTTTIEDDSGSVPKKKKKKKSKKKKRKDASISSSTTSVVSSSSSKPRKSSRESHRSSSSKSSRSSSSSKGSRSSSGSRPRKNKREANAKVVSGLTSALDAAVAGVSALGPADFEVGAGHDDDTSSLTNDDVVATTIDMTKDEENKKRKKKKKKKRVSVTSTSTTSAESQDEITPVETVPIVVEDETAAQDTEGVIVKKDKTVEVTDDVAVGKDTTVEVTNDVAVVEKKKKKKKKKKKRDIATTDNNSETTTDINTDTTTDINTDTTTDTITDTTTDTITDTNIDTITDATTDTTTVIKKKKKKKKKSQHRRSSSSSSISSSSSSPRTSSLENVEAAVQDIQEQEPLTEPPAAASAEEAHMDMLEESLGNGWDDPMLDQGFDLMLISPGFAPPKPITTSTSLDASTIDPDRKLSIIELRELRTSAVLADTRCYWDEWWTWYAEIYADNQNLEDFDVPMSVCAMTTPNTALLELDDDLNPTHPIHSSNIKKDSITQLRDRIESQVLEEESEEELSIFDMHMMGASSMSSMSSLLGNTRRSKPGIFGIDSQELELSPRSSVVSELKEEEKAGSMSSSGGESSKSTTSILASAGCRGRNKSVHWPELNRLFEFASEDEDIGFYEYEEEEEEEPFVVYEGHAALIEDDEEADDTDDYEMDEDDFAFQLKQNDQDDFSTRYLVGAATPNPKESIDENSSIVWGNVCEDEEDTMSSEDGSAHFVDLGGSVEAESHEVDGDDYPDLEPWSNGLDDTVAAVGNRVSFERVVREGGRNEKVTSAGKTKTVVEEAEASADDYVSKLMAMSKKKDKKEGSAVRSWAATNGKTGTRNKFGSIATKDSFMRALKEQQEGKQQKKKKKFEASNPIASMPVPRGTNDILEKARRSRLAERKRSKNGRRHDSFADAVTKLQDQHNNKNQRPNLHKAKMSVKRVLRRASLRVGLARPSRGSLVET